MEHTADSFTAAFAQAARQQHPQAQIVVEGPLAVSALLPDGGQFHISLDQPWLSVCQGAEAEETLNTFLTAMLPEHAPEVPTGPALHAALRPVIKPIAYVRALFDQLGQGAVPAYSLVGDLYIVLVADLGSSMAVVTTEQLTRSVMAPQEALMVAIQNLANSLGDIELHGERVRMFVAGGNFEASLLLISSIWQDLARSMTGEPVAVPLARDLLVFTDGGDAEGLDELKTFVEHTRERGLSYAISETVLRWRGGRWQVVGDEDEGDGDEGDTP